MEKICYLRVIMRITIVESRLENKFQEQKEFFQKTLESFGVPFYIINIDNYNVKHASISFDLDLSKDEVKCYSLLHRNRTPCRGENESCPISEIRRTKKRVIVKHIHYDKTGNSRVHEIHAHPIFNDNGNITHIFEYLYDISSRRVLTKLAPHSLVELPDKNSASDESYELISGTNFEMGARNIFDSCKDVIGATSGYVALLSKDGTLNEVVFLDSGGLTCNVDPSLLMPIRGLRAKAYKSGNTVFENDFPDSSYTDLLPDGHVKLKNVLFAPLNINGKTVGIIGLANKPGNITEYDAQIASMFGDIIAKALDNSYNIDIFSMTEDKIQSNLEKGSFPTKSEMEEFLKRTNDLKERIIELNSYHEISNIFSEQKRLRLLQEQFIAVSTHELRTPMTVIKGYIDFLLRYPELTIDKITQIFNIINKSVDRLIKLINNVSVLSKIQTDIFKIYPQPIKIIDLLSTIQEEIQVVYSHRIINLNYIPHLKTINMINIDKDGIIQVLNNLVSNAVKNSPKGSIINISVILNPEKLVISVQDQGPGIPTHILFRLFQPFSHFDTEYSSGGTGLGLFIVKTIVQEHEGIIEVHSIEDIGSTFVITLPIKIVD